MPPETRNPATCGMMQQGLDQSKRTALISKPDSTKKPAPEVFAAHYLSQKYGLTEPVARVVVLLAGLGGRLS